MRKILIIAALLLSMFKLPAQVIYPDPSIFNGYSGGEDAYVNLQNTIEEAIGNITIALMPFDGAYGVNMRDTRYPAREVAGNSILTYEDIPLNQFSAGSNLDKYNDEQMILMGGVEGVPVSLREWVVFDYRYEEHKESLSHLPPFTGGDVPNFRVRFKDGLVENVDIVINSTTDFMYISQSNPIYQREYKLYVAPRYGAGYNQTGQDMSPHESESFTTISPENNKAELIFHSSVPNRDENGNITSYTDYDYMYSWFDLVLGLPYDQVNETGVILDNVEYPLSDSDDYSSVISVEITWRQPFEIAYSQGSYRDYDIWPVQVDHIWTGEGEWVNVAEGEIIYTATLSIPFSGFSSPIDIGPSDATGSLTVMLSPAASNLSLNDADTNREVKVAELDFIMNLPDYIKDNNNQYYDRDTYESIDINTNVWLFLSASPDPFNSNSNGFVLVHENAGNMLTSYNSATYEVITKGLGNSATSADGAGGDEVVFDGKAKTLDFAPAGGQSDTYIHTYCNASGGEGSFLPHEIGNFEIGGETFSSNNYHHYHEYHGEVYVKIEPTALKPEGMRAGRYTSEIYVHVMTTD